MPAQRKPLIEGDDRESENLPRPANGARKAAARWDPADQPGILWEPFRNKGMRAYPPDRNSADD